MCDEQWFNQTATLIAENIICISRTTGYDSLEYAKKIIIHALKQAYTKAIEGDAYAK